MKDIIFSSGVKRSREPEGSAKLNLLERYLQIDLSIPLHFNRDGDAFY